MANDDNENRVVGAVAVFVDGAVAVYFPYSLIAVRSVLRYFFFIAVTAVYTM